MPERGKNRPAHILIGLISEGMKEPEKNITSMEIMKKKPVHQKRRLSYINKGR